MLKNIQNMNLVVGTRSLECFFFFFHMITFPQDYENENLEVVELHLLWVMFTKFSSQTKSKEVFVFFFFFF